MLLPVLRQKPTQTLPSNLLKRRTICFYCQFDDSHFSNNCTLWYMIIECIELNWLCKHMKKVESSQAAIFVLNWLKQFFSVSVVNENIYSKMIPVSCTNTYNDGTDLVKHGMVKNAKTWISWKRNITFLRNKKILGLCLRYILRSYRFVEEVTFKR